MQDVVLSAVGHVCKAATQPAQAVQHGSASSVYISHTLLTLSHQRQWASVAVDGGQG